MKTVYYKRFTLKQRLEHISVMSAFTLLALTGMPQKFFDAPWASIVVNLLGGIGTARLLHRFAGIVFTGLVLLHLSSGIFNLLTRRVRLSIVPNRKDFGDAVKMLKYYLGLSDEHADFDRFDYRQKFEYWGLVAGAMIMVVTGMVLYLPTLVTHALPGVIIPAAKVAHSNEGLMAFLVVILWHVYNAHLNPDVFPFDTSIFTGLVSKERMEHEHPLELARMERQGVEPVVVERPEPPAPKPAGWGT